MSMKRIAACLLALALLLGAAALADPKATERMVVTNCDEWVSLRAEPDTDSERLIKVPLNATVTNCAPASGGFTYCEYEGRGGYILSKYLAPAAAGELAFLDEDEPVDYGDANHNVVLDATADGAHVVAVTDYNGSEEVLTVVVMDADTGDTLWTRTLREEAGQTDSTAAFLGGTADAPRLMLYGVKAGLSSCDLRDGEALWTLKRDKLPIDGSLIHAVADNGAMALGGWFGPDPIAVDMDGNVLWRSDSGSDDTFWLYEIQLRSDCIAARYEHLIDEDEGWVYYGYDGKTLGIERD